MTEIVVTAGITVRGDCTPDEMVDKLVDKLQGLHVGYTITAPVVIIDVDVDDWDER